MTRSYTNEIYNHYNAYDSPSFSDSISYPGAEPQAIEAGPSTVSVPAPQGAESSVSLAETPVVNETVARNSTSSGPEHSEHPAGQPAEPESINT